MKYRWSYFKQYEKQNELIYKKISKEKLFHSHVLCKNIQYKFLQLELKQKKIDKHDILWKPTESEHLHHNPSMYHIPTIMSSHYVFLSFANISLHVPLSFI